MVAMMVRRALIVAFLLAALFVSVAGAACPPMAELCPMHSAKEGCVGGSDDCCPGTTSSELTQFQAKLLPPLQITPGIAELASDLQPFLQPSSLDQQSCASAVPADFNSLFCVLLI